jgi:hypothetical protein
MSSVSSKGKEPSKRKKVRSKSLNEKSKKPEKREERDETHLINRPLPVSIKIRRLVLGLVRAALADGERGDAARV